MDYGWGMFFWFVFVLIATFAAISWWPGRGRIRTRGRGPAGDRPLSLDFDSYPPYMDWDHPYGMGYMRYGRRHHGRGPRSYRRSDERIAEDINDRLMVAGELDASDIAVQVVNGKVTLTGGVPARADKRLAEWIADSVPGVTDVVNELAIRAIRATEPEREARDKTAS